jgi:hypothetical protein
MPSLSSEQRGQILGYEGATESSELVSGDKTHADDISLGVEEKISLSTALAEKFRVGSAQILGSSDAEAVVRFQAFGHDPSKQVRYDRFVASKESGKKIDFIEDSRELDEFERAFSSMDQTRRKTRHTQVDSGFRVAAEQGLYGERTRQILVCRLIRLSLTSLGLET